MIKYTDELPPTIPRDTLSGAPQDTLNNPDDSIMPNALPYYALQVNVAVYPNPATDRVMVQVDLPDGEPTDMLLSVYSADGKWVRTIYANQWQGVSDLPTGVYTIRQEVAGRVRLKPSLLMIHK